MLNWQTSISANNIYTPQNWFSSEMCTCLCFPKGQAENPSNLQVLIWIRNDRNSDERLIESQQDLDRFVAELNRHPRSLSGILRKPTDKVRTLTADAYPGMNRQSLQVLWARHFPAQQSINILWSVWTLCLVAAAVCAVAYWRQSRSSRSGNGSIRG
jgi:hypothetical protein